MAYVKIPINCSPNTEYACKISLKENTVNLDLRIRLNYSDFYGYWMMDVIDGTQEVLTAVPLVPGVNLLGQYEHLDIGEAYIIQALSSELMQPDNNQLGVNFILCWGDST